MAESMKKWVVKKEFSFTRFYLIEADTQEEAERITEDCIDDLNRATDEDRYCLTTDETEDTEIFRADRCGDYPADVNDLRVVLRQKAKREG